MFYPLGKKDKPLNAKPPKDLTRIIPATLLLTEDKRKILMQQIKELCSWEESRFNGLGLTLLHNLADYFQSLPETATNYYSQPGGLLDHALNRTEAALTLFKQYLVLEKSNELSEEQILWQYALFSASLLQGIGKLQLDYTITIYDTNYQQRPEKWNPLLEDPAPLGHSYHYEFRKEPDFDFRRRINSLLARRIMPISGFDWIASNEQVLAVWLALLNEDPHAAGTLGAILVRADAIALARYLNQLTAVKNHNARNSRYGRIGTFTGGTPESPAEIERQLGGEFAKWLKNKLDVEANGGAEANRIMINKAPLLSVPGGLQMLPEIFQLFIRENPMYKNWQAVQNGFVAWGIHHFGTEKGVVSGLEKIRHEPIRNGIVFENYEILLSEQVEVYNANTGKSSIINTTELPHTLLTATPLPHLTVSGQWQMAAAVVPHTPQLGIKTGG